MNIRFDNTQTRCVLLHHPFVSRCLQIFSGEAILYEDFLSKDKVSLIADDKFS